MAAGLSLSRATITCSTCTPPLELVKVSLIVRQNVATVRRGKDVLQQRTVTAVVPLSRTEWDVTIDDGQVWHVKRHKGG